MVSNVYFLSSSYNLQPLLFHPYFLKFLLPSFLIMSGKINFKPSAHLHKSFQLSNLFVSPSGPFVATIFMTLSYVFSSASFAIVAISEYEWQAIFGTVLMSLGHGFSEIFGLSYSTKYNR